MSSSASVALFLPLRLAPSHKPQSSSANPHHPSKDAKLQGQTCPYKGRIDGLVIVLELVRRVQGHMRPVMQAVYTAPAPAGVEQATTGQKDKNNAGNGYYGVLDDCNIPMGFASC